MKDPDGNCIVFGLGQSETPRKGVRGPLQHLTLATRDPEAIERFYVGTLGFATSDYVRDETGRIMACWMRSNHEHHTLACFRKSVPGIDHHSYNLFIFIEDPDRNWIEISAELEVVHDRAAQVWPHEEHTVNLWGRGILRQ